MADDSAVRARDNPNDPHYLELLLAHAHDGLAVIDPTGAIVASTPSLDRLLLCEAGELVGVDGLSLIHPDDVEHVALRLAEYVSGGNDGPDVRTRIRRPTAATHTSSSSHPTPIRSTTRSAASS